MEGIFFGAFAFVVYTYAVFPLLVAIAARARPRPRPQAAEPPPPLTVVIPAYNEAACIGAKLRNILDSDYPAERLRVIVVSDGSADGTADAVRSVHDARITLIELPRRRGKPVALDRGVRIADTPIVVLTDAQELFDRAALARLAAHFNDPRVGCVSGELHIIDAESGVSRDLGLYWRYEKAIRAAESEIGSVVGATGSICALRRACYVTIPEDTILDDVAIPFEVVRRGYRVAFESRALAYEKATQNGAREYLRKRRTLAGNYQLLFRYADLLVPGHSPIAWQFWSHKVFRLLVPYALLAMLVSSAFLPRPIGFLLFAAQIAFYGIATLAGKWPDLARRSLFTLPYTFCMLNWAAIAGGYYYFAGLQGAKWEKVK